MQTYKAPLRDMRFLLHELENGTTLPGSPDPELVDSVLEQAARFAETILLPLNAPGDAEGCRLENGVVRTPAGLGDAYRRYAGDGWTALGCDPADGGQGLPETVAKLVEEMTYAANVAFSLYPGLSRGAYQALRDHAAPALRDLYLPKLADGGWSGTMCLTEPQAGSDLGLLRTRAVPRADGAHGITGGKIFVTAGEHDLTDNIVHLVLARLPDAPPGSKGISLFLVPKYLPDSDGKPGARNAVTCLALEHKMGIRAAATCQLAFDDATGWLVGAPHEGLRAMFTMMNSERLSIGIQGLGIAEAAYQSAVAYARTRLQGRAPGRNGRDGPADPILAHPDVRRMLLTMRATTEGCRALAVWVAHALDTAARSADPLAQRSAEDRVALMTPVVKALFTDLGFEAASLGVQVHGGHGYINDHGVEQYVRDARIAMLYEGTNGIQALDLVRRKLPADDGRALNALMAEVRSCLTGLTGSSVADVARMLTAALAALERSNAYMLGEDGRDAEAAAAAACDYLRLLGLVALGFMWARMAGAAQARLAAGTAETAFYEAKLATARFFALRLLPQAAALDETIRSGKQAVMALEDAAF